MLAAVTRSPGDMVVGDAADFRGAIRLVASHRDQVAALFTHRFPLARAAEAIACVANSPQEVVKVLVVVDGYGR